MARAAFFACVLGVLTACGARDVPISTLPGTPSDVAGQAVPGSQSPWHFTAAGKQT